jgi:hypothetical protein
MDRIFTSLASFTILLMLIAVGLGLALHAAGPRNIESESAMSWYRTHFMVGVGVGLAVVLVNSLVMTWFVGTSRWCKEVAEAYSLDRGVISRSNRVKRGAFPYALVNMLIIVGVLALGGAADPSGNLQVTPPGGLSWAQWHLLGSFTALAVVAAGSVAQWRAIRANQQIIQQVMADVGQIRRQRGLPTPLESARLAR